MKRFLLSLVLIIFTINTLFAQRDTEHWIAPYYATVTGYDNKLYLSTDSTTPFPVQVFSDDDLIETVTIAKGDPKTVNIEASLISASGITDAFVVGTKGLHLKAEKPFYCSLRLAQYSHGEIITSKGKAGIGKLFYVATSPNTRGVTEGGTDNFTAGILATEDNTSVTVSWKTPGLKFINGNPPAQSHSFVLNKGQSFIFAGNVEGAANNNKGFIGAKIVASKPVTLTNGSCNGNFSTPTGSPTPSLDGSDPILDQSVPVDRLGNTFAMVKTKSTQPESNMEGGLIIATEDNTEVYINGATTPIATLNEGGWYRINETSYSSQAGGAHSNMFISTTKNVYLYQFIGVLDSDATNGFNYIPPLNCFLPRRIEEIGKTNEMPGIATSDIIDKLKLNILTEVGATVLVNGVPPTPAQGPYPLTGNAQWVTYSLQNFPANLTITSTKAVTAGINGGYSTAGYGGYFAGFSSVPVIAKKSGECAPGIVLQVDDTYDTYQWFLNDVAISGANAYTYSPTQPGYYTVKVTMGACQSLTTPVYKVLSCLMKTTKEEPACSTKIITPTFTSSTQTPVVSTIKILTPPTNGTAVINPDGTITYTPKPNFEGTDEIVYTFCGDSADFMDCEEVTLKLKVVPFIVKDATIKACWYDVAPYAYFDLTKANVTDYGNAVKKYYRTLKDLTAGINEITTPENFPSTGGFVYVKITTEQGCSATAKVELIPLPIKKSPILVDKYICIDDKTDLEAGSGYDSYQWSTGATTSGIRGVGVGEYSVILEKNGCFITQVVRIRKAVDPVIQQIEINNTTATVIVAGGKAPYKYSVDGTTNWQDSNSFTGLSRGQHKFYVKDAYNCTPISAEVTVPNLLNAITPNGDNINDYIDYSDLAYKDNLSFVVYDRYGNMIFTGNKFNNYKWDGRHFDKKLVTGTYWYHVSWNESNKEKTEIKYTGWIMVKNRE